MLYTCGPETKCSSFVIAVEKDVIWYENQYESSSVFYFKLFCPYKAMCVFAFEECIWALHTQNILNI